MSENNQPEIYSRAKSFQYAFEGLRYVLTTQHNARIHAIVTLFVLGLGLWLKLDARDWAILTITIVIVWIAELMNTALEALVDLSQSEFHPLAKIAKDVAATAVLMAAIAAVIVGFLIMGPPLWKKLF